MNTLIAREKELAGKVEAWRTAYLARDVDALVEMYAPDAELVAAPGIFRGRTEIRKFLAWDAALSPTVSIRDVGIGVCIAPGTVVWERSILLTYEGIPYHEDAAAILEFDDAGLIRRYRSYYDKLAIVQQVSAALPGPGGWFTREVVGVVVAAANMGLED